MEKKICKKISKNIFLAIVNRLLHFGRNMLHRSTPRWNKIEPRGWKEKKRKEKKGFTIV